MKKWRKNSVLILGGGWFIDGTGDFKLCHCTTYIQGAAACLQMLWNQNY